MPLSQPEEVLTALKESDPERLIGTPETGQIDFKSQPYDLTTDKGKSELAKDVVGLANHLGGVLVIGIATVKTAGNFLEVADKRRPIPANMFDAGQYRDIIRDRVRPAVGFEIEYYPDPDTPDKGYMTISVAPLDEGDRWALVRRMVDDLGRPIEGINVPIRDSDQTRWLSADEVYYLIRDGYRANRHLRPVTMGSTEVGPVDWGEAAERLITYKDWDSPVLLWQSSPRNSVDILREMWGSNGIVEGLLKLAPLRQSGFNWQFFRESVTPFDNGVQVSDGRRAIWIQENGSMTGAATVSTDMLSWAIRELPDGSSGLNLIAIVEMTLEYFRIIDEIFRTRIPEALYMHAIVTHKFAEEPGVTLSPALPGQIPWRERRATDDARREFKDSLNAEYNAYEALWRLFASFQLGPDDVPFDVNHRIDTESFLEYVRTQR